MSIKKYLAEGEKHYQYRLKTVMKLDDDAMDRVERVLLKHLPVDISRPKKMMFQARPLDFTNVENAEIYFVDFTLELPASPNVLESEIRIALKAPAPYVIVRGFNDPTALEQNLLDAEGAMAIAAAKEGMTPGALMDEGNYADGDEPETPLYGDAYNAKLKDYLRTIQKDDPTNKKIDAPNALFKWMDMPKDGADDNMAFNNGIKDAPGLGKAGTKEKPVETSPEGNLDDTQKRYKRLYGKDGTRVALTRTSDEVRKGGN
jgi:hypothetical protein